MKRLLINIIVLLFTVSAFGQVFKPVQIDSLITASLPVGYTKKDTLGQHIYSGNGQYGYMVVIRENNPKGKPLKKENDLKDVLKKYVKGIQTQSGAGSSVQNLRDTTVGRLEAKVFTLSTDPGTGVEYRNFLIIYTEDATYTFEYVYPEARANLMKAESKAFFSSLKLSPELQRNDQYTDTRKSTGMSTTVKIAIAVGVIALIIVLFLVFKKKKTRH